jgi:gliding motility-associated-like protein
MRENYLRSVVILLLYFFCLSSYAQQNNDNTGTVNINPVSPHLPTAQGPPAGGHNQTAAASTVCNCWIDRDATWSVAPFTSGIAPDYRNDDGSTSAIPIPFNFCFYGQMVNQVYINNNGNISIGYGYSTFSATSFPDTFKMIAPFWADVDTRGPLSGIVWYKVDTHYMIVQWDNVGYYNSHDDKLSSFQLILTDGTDPIIRLGQNVAFCYKDMSWTTGDASQGVNGWGGIPATVGVNSGNGINYIQFGRFDTTGSVYDGPFGNSDGVDWLDGQTFTMNACIANQSSNIPPVLNALNVCDTIRVCENSTYNLTANYLSPEAGQSTHIVFYPFGMQDINVVTNDSGPTATLVVAINGSANNIGFHTVSVTAIDNGSPAASTVNNFVIEVIAAPLPTFNYTPPNFIQTNTVVTFTNTTTAAAGTVFTWDFGDGSAPLSSTHALHNYLTPGAYTVTLTATYPGPDSCVTTSSQVVVVCGPVSFTTTNQCVGDPSMITYTSPVYPGANFTWDFAGGNIVTGSGSGPYSVTWPAAGTYNVIVVVADSLCAASDTQTVTINATPTAAISAPASVCAGDTPSINFNGSAGAAANYTWNFGAGAVQSGSGSGPYSVQYNTTGSDQISLIVDENGCSDTTSVNVTINPIPTSPFTIPPTACAFDPLTITYTGNAGAGANYIWNFDSATVASGTGAGPYSVNWNTGGNYNVTLTVEENGCTSTASSMPVAITATPVVSISNIAPLCEGGTTNVSFTGTAGGGATYNWNFGNATVLSGSGAGPYSLQWMTATQDQVVLSVTENNCTSADTISVTVNAIPTSVFTVDNSACIDQPVGITYTGSAGAAGTYNWSFAGANVISGAGSGPYSLSWNASGIYQVTLTVTENNCTSTVTALNATVNPSPVALAGIDQASCSGISVPLGDQQVAGNIYTWSPASNLSDPTISNPVATIQNSSNSEQQSNYILTVTDGNGCTDIDSVVVTTHPVPVVSFPALPGQCIINNSFAFSASSNISGNMNYNWQFSGPASIATSNQQSALVSYSAVGVYPVTLSADYVGCPAQPYNGSVEVYAMPMPDFSALNIAGCRPLTVSFSNLTIGTGNFYNWNFGDGGNSNTQDPLYTFNTAGSFSVDLQATTSHGCTTDTIYHNLIKVYPDAIANFLPSPPVANILAPVITFNDYSVNAYTYVWDFGDSTPVSTDPSPSHTYASLGTYDVTLMIVSPNGCVDTVHGSVKVEDNFSFYIPNSFSPNGDGVNDIFGGYGVAFDSYNMRIYNRWGELIYNTNDIEKPWTGTLKNGPVPNDTYVYRIELVDLHGQSHTFVGNVSVVY